MIKFENLWSKPIIFVTKFQTKKIVTFINRLFVYIGMSKYVSNGIKRQTLNWLIEEVKEVSK